MSANALVTKLANFGEVNQDDSLFLQDVLAETRQYEARSDIVLQKEEIDHVHIVLEGLACRYKRISNGRQISDFLLPGDFCDLRAFLLARRDHSISCISNATICRISNKTAHEMLARPSLSRAILTSSLVDESILREWITNIGQRNAEQKMAHLFCEIFARMKMVQLVNDDTLFLDLKQQDLADALGLSLVHTNKSLKKLREEGLVELRGGKLVILDMNRLLAKCKFDPDYLHLGYSQHETKRGERVVLP